MTSDDQKEIFVSCASGDRDRANELVGYLEKEGCTAFIFTRDIPAAAEWEEVLVRSLQSVRLVVVLLSTRTKDALYQRVEIRLAIELWRDRSSDLQIAPVSLEEFEDPLIGFGLSGFNNTPLHKIGAAATAKKVAELLGHGNGAGAPEADREDSSTFAAYFHRASSKIDRTQQWVPITEICAGRENAMFLLHGPQEQNLDLFVSRLWFFLSGECARPHRCYVIPLQQEYSKPRSAAGWETNLCAGLSRGQRRRGKAVDLLREAARRQSVFLVLNRLPIGVGDLEPREVDALEEFLSQGLPRLIAEASKGGQPIRALLTTHYDSVEDSLVGRLDGAAHRGCEAHGLRYRKLAPVRRVTWEDVEDFLHGLPKRPPPSFVLKLKEMFERLDSEKLEFRDIVDLLDRQVGE